MLFPAIVLLVFGGCSPLIKSYSEAEPGLNLSQYCTYDWDNTAEMQPDETAQYLFSPSAAEKVRVASDVQMKRYGFYRFDFQPGLLLRYQASVKNRVDFRVEEPSMHTTYPESAQFGNSSRVSPVPFQEGTLTIDFVDAQSGLRVWRGVALLIVEKDTPGQWDMEIEKTVQRIFNKLPKKPLRHSEDPVAAR